MKQPPYRAIIKAVNIARIYSLALAISRPPHLLFSHEQVNGGWYYSRVSVKELRVRDNASRKRFSSVKNTPINNESIMQSWATRE